MRRAGERDLARTINPLSLVNHGMLLEGDGAPEDIGQIDMPVLVIHGTSDPLLPFPHGEALAKAIPGATLVAVDGGGHEVHEGDWDQILGAILDQT